MKKNKDSFEESRRVWKGSGFIKYKSLMTIPPIRRTKEGLKEFLGGRTKWTERELNIFEFNQQ